MSKDVRIRADETYDCWVVEVLVETPACPRLGIPKPTSNWVSMSWWEDKLEAEVEKKRMEDYYECKDLLM